MADSDSSNAHPRLAEGDHIPAASLEQLLQTSLALQGASGNTQSAAPMKPEDAKWLSEALNGIFFDPAKEMVKLVKETSELLAKTPVSEDVLEQIENLGQKLEDFIVDLDLANDFAKVGGLDVIKSCLDRDEAQLRVIGCQLSAEMAQNNEIAAGVLVSDATIFDRIVSLLKSESEHPTVRIKALYAISCIVREYPGGQDSFLDKDGPKVLACALASSERRLQIKTSFLLQSIVNWSQHWHEALMGQNVLSKLAQLYAEGSRREDDAFHEMTLKAIAAFVAVCPDKSLELLKDVTEFNFKQALRKNQQLMSQKSDNDLFMEESRVLQDLMKRL